MRFHLPSLCDVKSKSESICAVDPGRHSEEQLQEEKHFTGVQNNLHIKEASI